jgi:hypothetical protein
MDDVHPPFWQTPDSQTLPQPPQLAESLSGLTSMPLQIVLLISQVPLLHV